jgi:hypothetical protein
MQQRLAFLCRVVRKEAKHLQTTDTRLFAFEFTPAIAAQMEKDIELAEQVEAFVGRFGRLQDSLGDKLLPALLTLLGEKPGVFVDNLDKAERFGFIQSGDEWLIMRQLRNQMVHEYIEDTTILVNALNTGHQYVARLIETAERMVAEIERRL